MRKLQRLATTLFAISVWQSASACTVNEPSPPISPMLTDGGTETDAVVLPRDDGAVLVCDPGRADCDLRTDNGCEADLGLPDHCGACGAVCALPHADPGCVAGACTIAVCDVGFDDCDSRTDNGCETDLSTSSASCGSCGNACAGKARCRRGECSLFAVSFATHFGVAPVIVSSSDVAVDADKRVVVTGAFGGAVDFGSGPVDGGIRSGFVARYDTDGSHDWTRVLASDSGASLDAVSASSSGDTAALGLALGPSTIDGGTTLLTTERSRVLVVHDPDGTLRWSRAIGGDGTVGRVAFAPDGTLWVVGQFFGRGLELGGAPISSAGGADIFVSRYDADGSHIFSAAFGSVENEFPIELAVTEDRVFVVGLVDAPVDFGGGPVGIVGATSPAILALDYAGRHVWSSDIADAAYVWAASAVEDTLYVAGSFAGEIDLAGAVHGSLGDEDVWLAAFDATTGMVDWARTFGTAGTDRAPALQATSDGVWIGGFASGPIDLGGGPLPFVASPLPFGGAHDAFLGLLGSDGTHRWSRAFAGPTGLEHESIEAIAAREGVVWATGSFTDAIDLGTGGPFRALGSSDVFLVRLD